MKLPRPRLTYANVVASLALFTALGGVSYAATTLPKNSVGAGQIQAEAVRTGKLADDAVTGSKLAQGVRERLDAVGGTPTVTTAAIPESVKHAETADRAGTAASANTARKADSATYADSAGHADSAGNAGTADLATTSKDSDALGGQPADHYLTADSVSSCGVGRLTDVGLVVSVLNILGIQQADVGADGDIDVHVRPYVVAADVDQRSVRTVGDREGAHLDGCVVG